MCICVAVEFKYQQSFSGITLPIILFQSDIKTGLGMLTSDGRRSHMYMEKREKKSKIKKREQKGRNGEEGRTREREREAQGVS